MRVGKARIRATGLWMPHSIALVGDSSDGFPGLPGRVRYFEDATELRRRLIYSAGAFIAVSIVAFMFFDQISDVLLRPLCQLPPDRLGPNGCKLVFTGAMEPISVRLKVTAMTGMVGASPVWLYQLWAFVVPGLTPQEKRYALPFVTSSVALFVTGVSFAYYTLPTALRFLIGFGGENLIPFFTANEYLSFVLSTGVLLAWLNAPGRAREPKRRAIAAARTSRRPLRACRRPRWRLVST